MVLICVINVLIFLLSLFHLWLLALFLLSKNMRSCHGAAHLLRFACCSLGLRRLCQHVLSVSTLALLCRQARWLGQATGTDTAQESDEKGHLQVMLRQAALRSAAVPLDGAL